MPSRRPGSVTAAAVLSIIYGSLFTLCGLCGLVSLAAQDAMGGNFMGGGDAQQFQRLVEAGAEADRADAQRKLEDARRRGVQADQEKFQKELDEAQRKLREAKRDPQKHIEELIEKEIPAHRAVNIAGQILGLAEAIALLVGGIGLLSMNSWARTLTITAAIIAIITAILQAAYYGVFVIPAMNKAFEAIVSLLPRGAGAQAAQVLQTLKTVMLLVTVGLLVFFILVVVYLLIIVILLGRGHVSAAFAGTGRGDFQRPDDDYYRDDRYPDDRHRDDPYRDDRDWDQRRPPGDRDDDWRYRQT